MSFNNNRSFGKDNNRGKFQEVEREFPFSKKGFVDEKGNLREALMTTEAEQIANYFGEDQLTKSQLRAFYNEIKAIKNKLSISKDEDKFSEIYPLILMIKSKVIYRASRGTPRDKKKMNGIKKFLELGIDQIKNENKNGKGREAFENFALFFEVVVGYAYGVLND